WVRGQTLYPISIIIITIIIKYDIIRREESKMAFWVLLPVAAMPVLRFLLISGLGAFLATSYMAVLTADARMHINK
ncbi:hypothetical protein KI387_010097, partial [Taxus chinensis]